MARTGIVSRKPSARGAQLKSGLTPKNSSANLKKSQIKPKSMMTSKRSSMSIYACSRNARRSPTALVLAWRCKEARQEDEIWAREHRPMTRQAILLPIRPKVRDHSWGTSKSIPCCRLSFYSKSIEWLSMREMNCSKSGSLTSYCRSANQQM